MKIIGCFYEINIDLDIMVVIKKNNQKNNLYIISKKEEYYESIDIDIFKIKIDILYLNLNNYKSNR